jgi:hypothetical protein
VFEEAAGLALVAAFYPPAMLIAAVYLVSERPGRMAVVYLAGGLLMVSLIGTIVLVAIRAGGLSHVGQHPTRSGLRLGLGAVALGAAVLIARRSPKPPDPAKPKKPSLVARLSAEPKALKAFLAGVVVFGPSVSFIAAVQVVATAKASVAATVGAMAMIIVLTVSFAWIPLLAYVIAPDWTIRVLTSFDQWLRRHGKTILVVAIGVIGIVLVIQGITGLA